MLKAMEGDTNPTIGTIRGAMQIGIQKGDFLTKEMNQFYREARGKQLMCSHVVVALVPAAHVILAATTCILNCIITVINYFLSYR